MKKNQIILGCALVLVLAGMTTLHAVEEGRKEGKATVRTVHGKVQYMDKGNWLPVKPNMKFPSGTTIRTGPDGEADVSVNGTSSAIRLTNSTTLQIPSMSYVGTAREGDTTTVDFPLEAHGFGAVLIAQGPPATEIVALMSKMKTLTARPLTSWSNEWRPLPQHMVAIASTQPKHSAPSGMIEIPGGDYDFAVTGLELEGGDAIGVDVAYPWEDSARRFHHHEIVIKSFYIDQYAVSNAQFKTFLAATKYHPQDASNFLRDWKNGTYPEGWANKPVTWVSLEDARAYAGWAGKRLPHEWEWQYAAQGKDGRTYPWGNVWKAEAVPVPEQGRALRGPDDGAAHPQGASPFNVMDLVGNIWQWTDEYADEHTRAAILRGGSYYQPQGSMWYFPQAYRNDQHGKLLLMAPGKDRAGTLGFRCVVDAKIDR